MIERPLPQALVSLAFGLGLGPPALAYADPAPTCASAQADESTEARIEVLRSCLRSAPGTLSYNAELVRLLCAISRYDEAMAVVQPLRSAYPEDLDLALLEARVRAWRGDLVGAWNLVHTMNEAVFVDREAGELRANLASWLGWDNEAERFWSDLIASDRAHAPWWHQRALVRASLGDVDGARSDFAQARNLAPERTDFADAHEQFLRKQAAWKTGLFSRYTFAEGGENFYDLAATWNYRLSPAWQIGVAGELRHRAFGPMDVYDGFGSANAAFAMTEQVSLYAAIGGSVDPAFSARFSAELEPCVQLARPLALCLRARYLDFEKESIVVLSPSVEVEWWRLSARASYFATLHDTPELQGTPEHSGHARLEATVTDRFSLAITGGAGTGSDYLEDQRTESSHHTSLGGGVSYEWQRLYRLGVDYAHYAEWAAERRLIHNRLGLSAIVRW